MRAVLGRLNRDELTSEDLASSEHIRAIAESRAQVLALFTDEEAHARIRGARNRS
jgi:hypothetical protein